MAVRKYIPDLRIGDQYTIKVRYKSGANITGHKIELTVKASFADKRSILHISTIAGDEPEDLPLEGICYLNLSSIVTSKLRAGSYIYSVRSTDLSGESMTLLPPLNDFESKINFIPMV